jgi:hypothetical protein
MKKPIVLAGIALACLASAVVQDAVRISYTPKKGSVSKYRLSSKSSFQGQESVFGAVLTIKIDSVEADGSYSSTATTSEMSLKMGDQDMSAMMGDASGTVKTKTAANGELLERTSSDTSGFDAPRLENAFTIAYPPTALKVGETWTRKYAGNKKINFPATETIYKYVGTEKLNERLTAHKLTFTFRETLGRPRRSRLSPAMELSGSMSLTAPSSRSSTP